MRLNRPSQPHRIGSFLLYLSCYFKIKVFCEISLLLLLTHFQSNHDPILINFALIRADVPAADSKREEEKSRKKESGMLLIEDAQKELCEEQLLLNLVWGRCSWISAFKGAQQFLLIRSRTLPGGKKFYVCVHEPANSVLERHENRWLVCG